MLALPEPATLDEARRLQVREVRRIGGDVRIVMRTREA
jgi:hypothetical protein